MKTAIKMIFRDMEYAKSLIRQRGNDSHEGNEAYEAHADTIPAPTEESWDVLSNGSGTDSPETSRKSTSTILDFNATLGSHRRSGHGLDGDTSASARGSEDEHEATASLHDRYDSDEL